jgi:hypothetical protein
MKKVFLVCAMGAFLVSCGKSACECKKETDALAKETVDAIVNNDENKMNQLKERAKQNNEDCGEYTEEDWKDCK